MILMGERITLWRAISHIAVWLIAGVVGVILAQIVFIALAPILLNLLYRHPRIIP